MTKQISAKGTESRLEIEQASEAAKQIVAMRRSGLNGLPMPPDWPTN